MHVCVFAVRMRVMGVWMHLYVCCVCAFMYVRMIWYVILCMYVVVCIYDTRLRFGYVYVMNVIYVFYVYTNT